MEDSSRAARSQDEDEQDEGGPDREDDSDGEDASQEEDEKERKEEENGNIVDEEKGKWKKPRAPPSVQVCSLEHSVDRPCRSPRKVSFQGTSPSALHSWRR